MTTAILIVLIFILLFLMATYGSMEAMRKIVVALAENKIAETKMFLPPKDQQ